MENIERIPLKCDHFREYNEIVFVKAAVISEDQYVFIGWRHANILQYMKSIGCKPDKSEHAQGFIDELGNYYRRVICKNIALRNGQLKKQVYVLTSEDLWDKDGNKRDSSLPYDPMGDKK